MPVTGGFLTTRLGREDDRQKANRFTVRRDPCWRSDPKRVSHREQPLSRFRRAIKKWYRLGRQHSVDQQVFSAAQASTKSAPERHLARLEGQAHYHCPECRKPKGGSFGLDTFRCVQAIAQLLDLRPCDCNSPLELRIVSGRGQETVVIDAFFPRNIRWEDRNGQPTHYPFLVFSRSIGASQEPATTVWMPSYLVHKDEVLEFTTGTHISLETFRGLVEQAADRGYALLEFQASRLKPRFDQSQR
jgi:hypothetical protein